MPDERDPKRQVSRTKQFPADAKQHPFSAWSQADLAWYADFRMRLNVRLTGHPFHHLTASGPVVDPDTSLEEAMRYIGPDAMPLVPQASPDPIPAIPADPNWYLTPVGMQWIRHHYDK